MNIKSFRDLIAWQKDMDLVVRIYESTAKFPSDERFGLTQQLRRAGVSIPSNIAEGHGRQSTKEFLHFPHVAYGSLNEVQTQIILAERLGYLAVEQSAHLIGAACEVARILNGLCSALENK